MGTSNQDPTADAAPHARRRHHVYNVLAWICFGLGFVGMVVPLMPTTVFWICAAWLWLRSRPHRVRFLIEHPHFGESIRRFLEQGEICRTGKTAAVVGMAGSLVIWIALATPRWPFILLVGGILTLVALWILTRPEGQRRAPTPTRMAVTLDTGAWARAKPPANPPG